MQYKSYDELPLMLSVPQLSAALGVSRTCAYELVRQRSFPCIRIGTRILVPKDGLIQWITAYNKKP